jgi:hypothetical protein
MLCDFITPILVYFGLGLAGWLWVVVALRRSARVEDQLPR